MKNMINDIIILKIHSTFILQFAMRVRIPLVSEPSSMSAKARFYDYSFFSSAINYTSKITNK
jgi:hypothetical protein